jgi:multiple sugar transport system permease protein
MEQNKEPKKSNKLLRKIEPYIWLSPSVILMVVMILVPIYTVFKISFSEVGRTGKIKGFNGIENYLEIFEEAAFWTTLSNTLVWTVVVVGLSTVIGFILAMVLNQEFKGRKFVRAVVIFPWATALIIQSVIWKYIINADYGSLNVMLRQWGIIDKFINWTATAGSMFAWECWVGIFVTFPFVTFCVLSGLQSIDTSLYEAADVDGATFWHKLFNITLPLVAPSLTVSTVLNIIYVFNSFPIVWTISKGAPADKTHTLVTYLYQLSFADGKSGHAAAVSVIGFVILAFCASISMILSLRGEEEN